MKYSELRKKIEASEARAKELAAEAIRARAELREYRERVVAELVRFRETRQPGALRVKFEVDDRLAGANLAKILQWAEESSARELGAIVIKLATRTHRREGSRSVITWTLEV